MTARGRRAALIGLLAGAAWAQPGADAQAATAEAGPERPNIVVILSDDEDLVSHAFMPKTKAPIEEQGAAFETYFVTYSFCCRSEERRVGTECVSTCRSRRQRVYKKKKR